MALRETHVDINFTANADPLRQMNNEINNVLKNTRDMGNAYGKVDDAAKIMLKNMKDGFKEQRDSMMKWRNDMIGAEYGYFMLAKRAKNFDTDTKTLMNSIMSLGATHKKATDQMLANDDRLKMSIYRTIGIMGNMTTQADKTKDAINLWQNPIYLASMGSLALLGNLQKVAMAANPAAMALSRLGKDASAKDLADEIQRINRGLGAMPLVFIGAGLAAIFFYGALHKAAMKNEEYANSWNTMKETLRKAIQPMIDVFIMVMIPVYNFITAIGQLIIKFNEAHPLLAKMIQGVLLLIPALTLLLLPMGLGIGLWNGYRMALFYVMRLAAPILTFLATLSPVVWIVAGAIVGLTVAFTYLYNNFAWFRNAVNAVFNFLKTALLSVVNAIKAYFAQVMAVIKAWWAENRATVMAAVQNIIALAKMLGAGLVPAFRLMWGLVTTIVKIAWEVIKTAVSIAIDVILRIIKFWSQVFTGDWKGAWTTVMTTAQSILDKIWNLIKTIFDKIMGFLRDFDLIGVGKDIMSGLWEGMKAIGKKLVEWVSGLAKSITKTFKKVMDINSPSREMFKLGSWTVEGQIDGMDSQRKHLMAISHEMAAMPMEYTPESTGTTTNNQSSRTLHFNPTIQISGGEGSGNVKQQAKEALEEAFDYLVNLYDVEVIR